MVIRIWVCNSFRVMARECEEDETIVENIYFVQNDEPTVGDTSVADCTGDLTKLGNCIAREILQDFLTSVKGTITLHAMLDSSISTSMSYFVDTLESETNRHR